MVSSLNKKIWRDLWTLKAQVMTLSVLVLCGVAMLISAWSAYQSLVAARDRYYAEYRFADVFSSFKSAPFDLMKKVEAISGVEVAEGRVVEDFLMDVPEQTEPAVGRFISITEIGKRGLNQIYLRAGRMPEPGQFEAVAYEAFMTAHRMHAGDRISVLFRGQKKDVVIVGVGITPEYVSAYASGMPVPDDKHFGVFWMDQKTLSELTNSVGAFNNVVVRAAKGSSIEEIKLQLDLIFKSYGALGAIGRDRQMSNMFVSDEIGQQKASAWFTPLIFLSVAAFLIHVVISRLMGLHRAQIATLKSLGYRDFDIAFYYVKLVFVMMSIGTVLGLLVGAKLGQMEADLYKDYFRFPSLDFSLSGTSILIACVAGILPGFIGALSSFRSIYKLQPAEAMRPLTPPLFRKGLFDKLGLMDQISMSGRMILRSLLDRPLRMILTVIGISFGIAVLINGGFWFDTMDYIIETQFQRANREDLAVQFYRPRSKEVLNELRRIPGVLLAEGYRLVPVRTRFEGWSRETALYGVDSTSTMRQTLDIEGQKIVIPEDGAYFSRFFAKKFGLKLGDQVDLEILEGTQKTLKVLVTGFVDDLVGSAVYVSSKQIPILLQEENVISVATLKVDPQYSNSIYVQLKKFPEVSSVSARELVYKGFMSTVAGMVNVFSWIIVGFAVAIAAAVMYNSARVSFSERSWELASLQIFGFGKLQTWQVLFTEIGIQVVLAILPGIYFGYVLSDLSTEMVHNETFKFPLRIETSTYANALFVLFLTYIASGLFIYRMVEKLDLVDALKSRE